MRVSIHRQRFHYAFPRALDGNAPRWLNDYRALPIVRGKTARFSRILLIALWAAYSTLSAAFSSGNDEKRIPDVSVSLPRVRLGRCTRVNSTLVYARYKLYTVTAAVTAPTMETLIYNVFARWNRDGPGKFFGLNLMDREIASQRYRPRTCMCRALWKTLALSNIGSVSCWLLRIQEGWCEDDLPRIYNSSWYSLNNCNECKRTVLKGDDRQALSNTHRRNGIRKYLISRESFANVYDRGGLNVTGTRSRRLPRTFPGRARSSVITDANLTPWKRYTVEPFALPREKVRFSHRQSRAPYSYLSIEIACRTFRSRSIRKNIHLIWKRATCHCASNRSKMSADRPITPGYGQGSGSSNETPGRMKFSTDRCMKPLINRTRTSWLIIQCDYNVDEYCAASNVDTLPISS